MLTEVGVKFGMSGAEDVQSKLSSLVNAWKSMSSSFEKTPATNQHFQSMATSAHAAAMGIQKSMGLIKVAIAGVLLGKAAEGLGSFLKGPAHLGENEDFLRMYGAPEERIKAFKEVSKKLNREISGFDKVDFMKGMFAVQSLHADDGMKQMEAVARSTGYLAKALRTNSTEAADYYKVMYSAFGKRLPEEQRLGFHGDVLSGSKNLLQMTGAEPEELKMAMRNMGSAYAETGRTWVDALTDMAMVVQPIGSRRGGTGLKNIVLEQAGMYAKLEEEVQKLAYEKMKGKKFYDMSAEEQKLFKEGSANEIAFQKAMAATLARSNPGAFWKGAKQKIEAIKAGGGDWEGKLKDTLGEDTFAAVSVLAEAWASGERQKTAEKIKAAINPTKTENEIRASDVSFESIYKNFDQKIGELKGKLRQLMAPGFTELFKSWGTSIEEISGGVDTALEGASGKFAAAIKAFKESFATGFGQEDLGIGKTLKDMVLGISAGEEAWKSLGAEIGKITGENLKSIVESLRAIADVINGIRVAAELAMFPFQKLSGLADSILKRTTSSDTFKKEQIDVATKDAYERGMLSTEDYAAYKARRGLSLSPTQELLTPPTPPLLAPAPVPYTKSYLGKLDEWVLGSLFQSFAPAAAGVPNTAQFSGDVNVNIDSLQIDGERLAGAITPRVKERIVAEFQSDAGRSRKNAMDSDPEGPWQ